MTTFTEGVYSTEWDTTRAVPRGCEHTVEGREEARPPRGERVTTLHTIDLIDDYRAMATFTGKDSPGILRYVSKRLAQHRVNIEKANATRMDDRYCISLLLYSPDPGRLTALLQQLRLEKDEGIQSKRVMPVKTYWLRVIAPDRPGLTHQVTQVLYENDLNLTGLAGTTHPAVSAEALGYPYPNLTRRIAALKLRIDVPLHRLDEMNAIRERIAALGEYWVVSLTESPERDMAPAWPGKDGDIYLPPDRMSAGR